MPFYTFNQNNPQGYFYINDTVAEFVIVEGENHQEAVSKMKDITSKYNSGCGCGLCPDRWGSIYWTDEDEATEIPMINDVKAHDYRHKGIFDESDKRTIIIYHHNNKEFIHYNGEELSPVAIK